MLPLFAVSRSRALYALALAMASLLTLASCASLPPYILSPLPEGAVELPFEIVSSVEIASGDYDTMSHHPAIGVVAAEDEIDQWQGRLAPSLIEQIRTVDFNRHFVVMVFRGVSGCLPPEDMRILQIVRLGQQIQVYAHFPVYPPLSAPQPCPAIVLYPAQIAQVQKEGTWDSSFSFKLMDGARSVATAEQWVP